ncbi:unnamed protein product [Sphenostylis stenocarpa]|uniref:Uncharacterized protein n=1 Tax=Sphenostylis stenocarpa TaxID=92480 RepID=A0AA86W346_9FABA|nr:unnamed protein product [Sphenostylis stenocarpa]
MVCWSQKSEGRGRGWKELRKEIRGTTKHRGVLVLRRKRAEGNREDGAQSDHKLKSRSNIVLSPLEASSSRRHLLVIVGPSLVTLTCGLSPSLVWAEEKSGDKEEEDKGIIGAIKSFFDPNEKTKSGKSAREVVKTLRESLNETTDDIAKFRRTADSAKESIQEYLGSWRGNQTIVQKESYAILEKVIRSFGKLLLKSRAISSAVAGS